MLTVETIANNLEKTMSQVHQYIRNKHLVASKVEGKYLIKENDYDSFIEKYYLKRHTLKGNRKIAKEEHINYLDNFVSDCKNDKLDYKKFRERYKDINTILPPFDNFILYIRNKHIIKDLKTMKQVNVADKYNLSLITIKKISSKSKQGSNWN